jgi:hypothetical protein
MSAKSPWSSIASCGVAGVIGLTVSFLTAGPALFADGPFAERPPVLVVSVILFALVGAAIAFVSPTSWKPVAITLALVAIPVPVYLGVDTVGQVPMMLLALAFVLGDAAAGSFGALAGATLRSARRSHSQ